MTAARERFYAARDGLKLYVADWGPLDGDRAPLLCLPGLTRNSKDFAATARRVSAQRRVLCPDLRGRGRSAYSSDWRTYEPRTYVDDVRHLLASLGVGHVVVLGTSLGGLLGMALATALPTVVAGLIVNDVGPHVEAASVARIMTYVGVDRHEADWPAAAAALRERFPRLSFRTEAQWLEFAHATYREGRDGRLHFDWDLAIAKAVIHPAEPAGDLWPYWRALGARPTLVIRGGASDILSAETFARMKLEKPDLVQLTVPEVGHAPSLAEPGIPEAIDDVLARC